MEVTRRASLPGHRLPLLALAVLVGVAAISVFGVQHSEHSRQRAVFCARLNLDDAHCAARMAENVRSWQQ
ncbi:hypothetical protein [Paraburkholderia sp. J8-2]|uniref:hypothetical protein n=1 Tax=Paraburkholderia sp. J8-2 TaxID=2805440 RepID=UPI002AB776F1|nr:hypothetical protein [Paraburkholderia sp. J8-2]